MLISDGNQSPPVFVYKCLIVFFYSFGEVILDVCEFFEKLLHDVLLFPHELDE